jgi:ketosteroid isomerase-like protein
VEQQPAAAAPAADTSAQDQEPIRATTEAWGKAIEDKNLDETVSFYADDAQNQPLG